MSVKIFEFLIMIYLSVFPNTFPHGTGSPSQSKASPEDSGAGVGFDAQYLTKNVDFNCTRSIALYIPHILYKSILDS